MLIGKFKRNFLFVVSIAFCYLIFVFKYIIQLIDKKLLIIVIIYFYFIRISVLFISFFSD